MVAVAFFAVFLTALRALPPEVFFAAAFLAAFFTTRAFFTALRAVFFAALTALRLRAAGCFFAAAFFLGAALRFFVLIDDVLPVEFTARVRPHGDCSDVPATRQDVASRACRCRSSIAGFAGWRPAR